jgi:acyl-CoA synthetase (AMP-forming)/AMP-acid ligase II
LRRAAERFGDRDYVVTPTHRLTFTRAEEQSRRLAGRLLQAGVGKGTRVGILFPQGPDFMVAFLAAARIGALPVLLSTFLKPPELRRAVRHADASILITPRHLGRRDMQAECEATWAGLAGAEGTQVWLDESPYLRQLWLAGGGERPWVTSIPPLDAPGVGSGVSDQLLRELEAEVAPSDLVVMIHTSGATADPKTVVHTHGAQVRQAWTLAGLYGLDPDVRTFTTMPFFWVGGLTVILLTHLLVGAAVLTVERLDGPATVDLLEREHATRLLGWTLLERLTSDPALADHDLRWLEDLQGSAAGDPRRHNSLGMSETSGPHSAPSISMGDDLLPERLQGSFGPAVPGVQHKIVDLESGSTELPEGTEGEILVRGVSLMDGLYKKERAATFDADGWYHTGDKGFVREGFLFFTGRKTEMIKTSGANVAPREVELALEALPGVQAAFVVGLADAERGELVAGLVCPEAGVTLEPEQLVAKLHDELSSYKVPRKLRVVSYDEAPWLPSGKISKPLVAKMLSEDPGRSTG